MAGSSPLARGLRQYQVEVSESIWIIPARAGFTRPQTDRKSPSRDHPRSRGVYEILHMRSSTMIGSSPLARGLPRRRPRIKARLRIIPARAGFTMTVFFTLIRIRDHPRSRGVYVYFHNLRFDGNGSSPLARGLPAEDLAGDTSGRIIPARAGFTRPTARRARGGSDHPRSRGVYEPRTTRWRPGPGSSPLARGLHVERQASAVGLGIIPARAGFTGCRRRR